MTKSDNSPLAWGPYVSAESVESISVWNAQLKLLDAISRVSPQVLVALKRQVFPLYSDLATTGALYESFRYEGLGAKWVVRNSDEKLSPKDKAQIAKIDALRIALKAAVDSWAAQYKFDRKSDSAWFKTEALRAMWALHCRHDSRALMAWNSPPVRSRTTITAPDLEITIRCRGWELELESFADYKAIAHAQLEAELARYEEEAHGFARSRFVGVKPELIKAPRSYVSKHFEWLALSQFNGMSSLKIAMKYGYKQTDSAVLKGIATAEKLLGIERDGAIFSGPLSREDHDAAKRREMNARDIATRSTAVTQKTRKIR